jgi:hypothetical protein
LGYTPKKISGVKNVTKLAGGITGHTLALSSDGTVWGWGFNEAGQLGDGTTTERTAPVQTKNLSGIVDIAATGDTSFALQSNGVV